MKDLKYLNKVSLFGIIEYFDHLNNPLNLSKIFRQSLKILFNFR